MEKWLSAVDAKTGQPYLYDPDSGRTRWLWSREVDRISGKPFYRNAITGERRWGKEAGREGGKETVKGVTSKSSATSGAKASHAHTEKRGKVPGSGPKVMGKDAGDVLDLSAKLGLLSVEELHKTPDGKYYAYNRDTKQSRWLRKGDRGTGSDSAKEKKPLPPERMATELQRLMRRFLIRKRFNTLTSSSRKMDMLLCKYDLANIQKMVKNTSLEDLDETERKHMREYDEHLRTFGELVTQELLIVDSVDAGGNELLRWKRKNTVKKLLESADLIDVLRREIKKRLNG